ncbi:MAG: DUF6428 family protein [Saprospiraceae bacterium]|nr:DUF6428 family protein [Saprospiraceae bacterium]
MILSEVKDNLEALEDLHFILPNGKEVPRHFHITEIGNIKKDFIDCGGTLRTENVVSFQFWSSVDYHHRLKASKLVNIIQKAESALDLPDAEVEVEYQGDTIGKYGLSFDGKVFHLVSKSTDCLAKENCGLPLAGVTGSLKEIESSCCSPESNCC